MEEKYFFTLHEFKYQEYEVWRQLCKFENYKTNIAGYTINQLVLGADKEAKLTTSKVRTILKNFEKKGYIKILTSGTKGKESTLKLTMRSQLFSNNLANKNKQFQQVQKLGNNNLTRKSQYYEKNKEKYNINYTRGVEML
jgi:DNA-binding MarR family transcriptional regulator